jgi:hypothetical protein
MLLWAHLRPRRLPQLLAEWVGVQSLLGLLLAELRPAHLPQRLWLPRRQLLGLLALLHGRGVRLRHLPDDAGQRVWSGLGMRLGQVREQPLRLQRSNRGLQPGERLLPGLDVQLYRLFLLLVARQRLQRGRRVLQPDVPRYVLQPEWIERLRQQRQLLQQAQQRRNLLRLHGGRELLLDLI